MVFFKHLLPLSLAALALAEPIHIPLARRSPHKRSIESYPALADHVRAKYGRETKASQRRRRGESVAVSLINQDADTSYLAEIQVGTPSQTVTVIMDTGSSDLWLASSSCSNCPDGTPEFDSSSSSTFASNTTSSSSSNGTIEITYGSGDVEGTLSEDTVTMAGLTVDPQTFLLVDDVSDDLLDGNVTGIMGLAFQGLAATGAVPFWQALISNDKLSSPEFSFYITRYLDDEEAEDTLEPGGYLTLGGVNASLYSGDITYTSTTDDETDSYWLIPLSEITVQGTTITLSDTPSAAIDTGTTLIGGPQSEVESIYSAVTGSEALSGDYDGYYAIPCSTSVNVSLTFGGKSWAINPDDMNLGAISEDGDDCLGGIFVLSEGSDVSDESGVPDWVVGDTFLKNVYSVFRSDSPAVGFAELSTNAGGTGSPASITASGSATSSAGASSTGTANGTSTSSSSGSSSSSSGSSSSSSASAVKFTNGPALGLGLLVSTAASAFAGYLLLA